MKFHARELFATNIRKARINLGFSQESFAELADLHRTYIGSVERGERNITIDAMEKISIALKIPLSQLLSEDFDAEKVRR